MARAQLSELVEIVLRYPDQWQEWRHAEIEEPAHTAADRNKFTG
jgi:hypothetical protein